MSERSCMYVYVCVSDDITSDAKANRFFSPPEIPLILPGIPIMTLAQLFKPICKATQT